MCYPKPGPRCSTHALSKLQKLKREFSDVDSSDFQKYFLLNAELVEAQKVFDATPAGINFLRDEILNKSFDDPVLFTRLEVAENTHKEQLLVVKNLRLKQKKHAVSLDSYVGQNFLGKDSVREDSSSCVNDDLIANVSEKWFSKLSYEELTQLRWMTDFGAMESNLHIAGKNGYGKFSAENIEKRMSLVDSALNKFRLKEPIVVYRGIRKGMLPDSWQSDYRVSDQRKADHIKGMFSVGEEFESNFFLPTSHLPSVASKFSDFGVVLEIKTRKAAPISALSMFHKEQEALIPRNQKYRVVGVHENVMYGKVNKTYVIQLEDID